MRAAQLRLLAIEANYAGASCTITVRRGSSFREHVSFFDQLTDYALRRGLGRLLISPDDYFRSLRRLIGRLQAGYMGRDFPQSLAVNAFRIPGHAGGKRGIDVHLKEAGNLVARAIAIQPAVRGSVEDHAGVCGGS